MTATAPAVEREPEPSGPAEPARRWAGVLVLVVCGVALLGAAVRVAVHDPTDQPISGDQSSFVYQALSLAGGDLAFDEADQEEWLDLDWDEPPRGLFVQKNPDGEWVFAKPYGYSLLLTPFVAGFGGYGITAVGALLLVAYAWCWYAIGRTRWRPPAAAVVATAATLASNAFPMAFPAHADLFVAVLVGLAVLAGTRLAMGGPVDARGGTRAAPLSPGVTVGWVLVGAAAAGWLVTEKLPALVVIGPVLAVALWRSPWRTRALAVASFVLVVVVTVIPYLHHSGGETWNAYGGDRYYSPGHAPWTGGEEADLVPWRTAESMSPGKVIDSLRDPSRFLGSATKSYVIGRHTGALTFQPVVATLAVATVVALGAAWHRRRREPTPDGSGTTMSGRSPDGVGPERERWPGDGWMLAAAMVGLAAYIGLYVVTFTRNYFGGSQSIGNRYFLQVSAVVVLIPVAAAVRERAALLAGAVGAGLGVALLAPQLFQPADAFFHIERTSPLQELLPFDHSQATSWRFECDPTVSCDPPPPEPYRG